MYVSLYPASILANQYFKHQATSEMEQLCKQTLINYLTLDTECI